ncbi:MAG: histidine phosphatase family protein [Planctomycetes bacterium]|nr:histidine phosphatase family protein [Planctomycetota bacterium]
MKTLLILRHAKSSWKDPSLDDHERPLNKRGKRDAPRMGRLLEDQDLVPDLVLCSTARRARATAGLLLEACGYDGELVHDAHLYHADPMTVVTSLREVPDGADRVLLIGHNPGHESLLVALTGHWEIMPTAALAHVELPIERWSDLDDETDGQLVDVWRPKELDS